MPKQYDQAYFDRWYRHPRHRVKSDDALVRKVRMVLALAEWYLEHPVRSVLDVGCGEAPWFPVLQLLRPKASYLGLDPSPYAVQRFGRTRNVRLCRFGELAQQRFERPVDLLVCADVLHYLPSRELDRGLPALAELCGGVAFIEAFAREDDAVGDDDDFKRRPAAFYTTRLRGTGLRPLGSHCWLSPALAGQVTALELPG